MARKKSRKKAAKKRVVRNVNWFVDAHYALKMKRDKLEEKVKEVKRDIEKLEGCIIAGRSCRRGSDRRIELVQIEPEGQNLTIVARTGAIDAAEFVRALTAN